MLHRTILPTCGILSTSGCGIAQTGIEECGRFSLRKNTTCILIAAMETNDDDDSLVIVCSNQAKPPRFLHHGTEGRTSEVGCIDRIVPAEERTDLDGVGISRAEPIKILGFNFAIRKESGNAV